MTIKGERLESALIKRVDSFLDTEVRPGENPLYLVDVENIKDPIKCQEKLYGKFLKIAKIQKISRKSP